ncbi:DUF1643 domain-containing protein [Paraburkholderia sp. SARCC-3016]|uniref:DUF1643 domain-containing protein n=1 Tax=Paraburkholderia sp. SARCC-3016 TaxID=3058611 RepID=UPI0028094686|nr:DUF1643 domain-containing protein [Paraburkholderia sp. SARCC-3016]MDQ7981943.1 DUF1643 domain-containing protein [Paraburkholderia sp. SARCC-3016]
MYDLFDTSAESSAVISECGRYRHRLDRAVQASGIVIAYYGVNGSTAGPIENDQTVKKWIGFTLRNGGRKFIVGNAFGYRATDVKQLALVDDPIGPDNAKYLVEIIAEADLHVPCWGDREKVPRHLRHRFDELEMQLRHSGKPIKIFGLTKGGDPLHPQMLGYSTKLVDWIR